MGSPVSGFSKKSKKEKIDWLVENYFDGDLSARKTLKQYWNDDKALQDLHDDFTENTISNYYLPFGVAPNFKINQRLFTIPMVIEESSVIAAASNAAKFWLSRGGFAAEVISTVKTGQIHLDYYGPGGVLESYFNEVKQLLIDSVSEIQQNMKGRGGGLTDIELIDATQRLQGYYQLHCSFETLDAMGANFINSCLETMAATFEKLATGYGGFENVQPPKVVMSILSNYVPDCLVKAEVSCPVNELSHGDIDGERFAHDFVRAVNIAEKDTKRAVTHNKGIMNGVDAVVLATGNDFRAVEAGVHAYASRSGQYRSLTHAEVEEGVFKFSIEVPLALGTVGGLTNLHPLVRFALQLLRKPTAMELMKIVAVAGLAQNFAAVKSLVTTGIQKGHMKMHLMNILNQMQADQNEKTQALDFFKDHTISHNAVVEFIDQMRK